LAHAHPVIPLRRWFALAFTLAALPALGAEPVRVACLGDSITAGAKVNAATESYPAQLQQMLGAGFVVKNFGIGGASMWHGGKPNAAQELPGATAFAPQIAIVMFGINDTRSRDVDYWSHFPEFEADASKLLDALLALPTKPSVLLCTPTPNFANLPGMPEARTANVAERLPRLAEVRAKVAVIAKKYAARGVQFVDMHAPLEKRPEVFDADGSHLKPPGYKVIAETLRPLVEAGAKVGK
jgi:lysophospholipase L1-like esterase